MGPRRAVVASESALVELTRTTVFPALLVLLDLGAAVMYGLEGDWRRGLYWLFAAGLTAVVTW